jgi:hypothetical protein
MLTAAIGWIGTIGSITAYLMLSRGQLTASSLRYSALNGLAGVLAGSASALYGAWPSVGSNILWSGIALHAAVTTVRARRAQVGDDEQASDGRDDAGPAHELLAA